MAEPKKIRDKVGRPPARNEPGDADVVTDLLLRTAVADGGADQPIFSAPFPGMASPSLVAAIEKFQLKQFGRFDGRCDPGGPSMNRLNALTANGNKPRRVVVAFVSLFRAAVGSKPAPNTFDDQVKALAMLSRIPLGEGGPGRILPPPVMLGQVSPELIPAIEAFQRRQFGGSDGRLDPGGKSELRMRAILKL